MKSTAQTVLILLTVFLTGITAVAQTTGGIKGKVRGAEGETLSGTTVTARQDGKDVKTVKANRRGDFVLDGLKPGTYNFVFELSGYTPGIRYDVPVEAGAARELGDRLILSKDESNIVFLRGSVFDRNGRSVQGARIEVHKISSDGKRRLVASSFSNYSGEFAVRQTDSDALYSVTATFSGKSSAKEIRVDSPGIHRVSITLDLER